MTAWRRAKRSAKCSDWNKFKKLRKQLKKRMKHKYQTFVEDLSDQVKTNPKTFWSFFHDKKLNLKQFPILSSFADDAKFFRVINNIEDCEQLQRDLNSLYEWSQVWKLNFNVLKCKILLFTRNVTLIVFKYHLNGTVLENISCFNDLGVTVDKGLVFNNHVSNVINKCYKVNGLDAH